MANKGEGERQREREREKGLEKRERSGMGGNRRIAWVDFDHWLKSTPEYFQRCHSIEH